MLDVQKEDPPGVRALRWAHDAGLARPANREPGDVLWSGPVGSLFFVGGGRGPLFGFVFFLFWRGTPLFGGFQKEPNGKNMFSVYFPFFWGGLRWGGGTVP